MARIFISYRRSDSAIAASTLTDKLQERFGHDSVFFDVDNIPFGVDFRKYIEDAVGRCDVLLVMMGNQWAQVVDKRGNKRIDNPSDYVRIEIESALKRGIPIIPVLVDEAELPSETDLPPSIQSIVFLNAAELSAGRDRHQHMERLIKGLEAIFSQKALAEGKAKPDEVPVDDIDLVRVLEESDDSSNTKPLPEVKETSNQGAAHHPVAKRKPKAPKPAPQSTSKKERVYDTEALMITNEGNDSSNLLGEIQKTLDGFTDKCLFVGELIPAEKVSNAIKAYADQLSPKDVLLLYDNTVFGGAKQGLLLTADAVYWRNFMGTEPGKTRYAEIQEVNFRKLGTTARLLINEKYVDIWQGADQTKMAEYLANVIQHLISRQTNLKH